MNILPLIFDRISLRPPRTDKMIPIEYSIYGKLVPCTKFIEWWEKAHQSDNSHSPVDDAPLSIVHDTLYPRFHRKVTVVAEKA